MGCGNWFIDYNYRNARNFPNKIYREIQGEIIIPGYPLVNDHIAIAGISPFSIGKSSTQSGSIFQPAMLVYPSVS